MGMDCQDEDEESKRPLYDVCFHLLKLYSDRYCQQPKWQLFGGYSLGVSFKSLFGSPPCVAAQTLRPAAAVGSSERHVGASGLPAELAPLGRPAGAALQPPERRAPGPAARQLRRAARERRHVAPGRLHPAAHPRPHVRTYARAAAVAARKSRHTPVVMESETGTVDVTSNLSGSTGGGGGTKAHPGSAFLSDT